MNRNKPILLAGCPRSGTSMVAGILQVSGAWGGNVTKMFENKQIRENITKPFLYAHGIDPNMQFPLQCRPFMSVDWSPAVLHYLDYQNYEGTPWYYKDSRILLTWKIWLNSFPEAKWVLVRRNEEDILYSCEKTAYMTAFASPEIQRIIGVSNEQDGWRWWIQQYNKLMDEIITAVPGVYVVFPEKMVNRDYSEIEAVLKGVGLSFDKKRVEEFIQPKLWKNSQKGD